jgi:cellulose synthase operon protein C
MKQDGIPNMTMRRGGLALLLVMALSLLGACESSKDKAARHLQAALELVEKGDPERAIVEFRNVFKLDPDNAAARMAFAGLLETRGSLPEAYAQYSRVIDMAPEDQEALAAAARIAAAMGNWADAGKRADAQLALKPGDPAMLAIRAAVDYATAFSAADAAGREKAAETARTLLAGQNGNLLLHRVLIDNLVQNGDYPGALAAIDAALAALPGEKGLYELRVTVLATLQDDAGVEAELLKMVRLFPEDPTMGLALLRWYVAHDQIDAAEAYLRGKVAADGAAGDLAARMTLVDFLRQYRSVDAALTEIDAILATLPATAPAAEGAAPPITPAAIRTLRASILFDQGKHDEAIKAMQDILAGAEASEQTRQIKVTLARMQFALGNSVQARALVEEVLVEDAGQTEALKLKAAWLTDEDKTDDAIALLRAALDANPRDPETMTLMAQAYERTGSHDLAADMLSQAVVASGKAPGETLRYAQFLMRDAKYLPAETLLINALQLDPANVALLAQMGRLYVLMADWSRATGVADRLDEIATPEAMAASQDLRPTILANQENLGSAIDYLQGLAGSGNASMDAQVALLRAYLANGQTDQARTMAADMLARAPQDPAARFVAATVKGATGDGAGAIADFRAMLAEEPSHLIVWTALVRQLSQDGAATEAEAALDEALTHLPDQGDLLLMKANFLELRQDADGAIAIYEKLYAADSSSPVVANNLASMLASYRPDDAPSVERAYVVARRLRGTTEPAFADTYGWIAQLRGNPQEALPYLETAAAGLPQDPMVQFHLAETYRALNRAEEARAQYAKVLELVPADDSRAFVQAARKEATGGG